MWLLVLVVGFWVVSFCTIVDVSVAVVVALAVMMVMVVDAAIFSWVWCGVIQIYIALRGESKKFNTFEPSFAFWD